MCTTYDATSYNRKYAFLLFICLKKYSIQYNIVCNSTKIQNTILFSTFRIFEKIPTIFEIIVLRCLPKMPTVSSHSQKVHHLFPLVTPFHSIVHTNDNKNNNTVYFGNFVDMPRYLSFAINRKKQPTRPKYNTKTLVKRVLFW